MVKIVTDSTADLPADVARDLGISVVPLYVRFGEEVYRDGVDMRSDEFYQRLPTSPRLPTTAAPSIGDFLGVYKEAAQGEGIVSIHISSKLSATCNAALQAAKELPGARVEVVDSLSCSMGAGLLAILAAQWAREGMGLEDMVSRLRGALSNLRVFALLDTLTYLQKGGRIGKAQALLGGLLNIKPLLSIKDGEVHPLERVRSRSRAIERLAELVGGFPAIHMMAVLFNTTPEEAEALAKILPTPASGGVLRARLGPVIGTYAGPGALAVALVEAKV
ncbi:MAG: DegV family protein [Chloroflexota bacterium]